MIHFILILIKVDYHINILGQKKFGNLCIICKNQMTWAAFCKPK